MSIFNKMKEYVIVTDMATNREVQAFANEHCADGCEIDVHVTGSLLEGGNSVTVTFVSEEDAAMMRTYLENAFKANYELNIRRKLIFVFKKEQES